LTHHHQDTSVTVLLEKDNLPLKKAILALLKNEIYTFGELLAVTGGRSKQEFLQLEIIDEIDLRAFNSAYANAFGTALFPELEKDNPLQPDDVLGIVFAGMGEGVERAVNALRKTGIILVRDLVDIAHRDDAILAVRNLGEKGARALSKAYFDKTGLNLFDSAPYLHHDYEASIPADAIQVLAIKGNMVLRGVLRRLKNAGIDTIPKLEKTVECGESNFANLYELIPKQMELLKQAYLSHTGDHLFPTNPT
jgi:hypothetical protein